MLMLRNNEGSEASDRVIPSVEVVKAEPPLLLPEES
jgi:hypothetical protein